MQILNLMKGTTFGGLDLYFSYLLTPSIPSSLLSLTFHRNMFELVPQLLSGKSAAPCC